MMHDAGLDENVCRLLGLDEGEPDLAEWQNLVERVEKAWKPLRIGIVGKYVSLPDAYLSVAESLRHAAFNHEVDLEISWIMSDHVEGLLVGEHLDGLDGIVLAGRIRRTWCRGQGRRRQLCPRERRAVSGPVSRHAGHDHRVRPQRVWASRVLTPASSTPRTPPHPIPSST